MRLGLLRPSRRAGRPPRPLVGVGVLSRLGLLGKQPVEAAAGFGEQIACLADLLGVALGRDLPAGASDRDEQVAHRGQRGRGVILVLLPRRRLLPETLDVRRGPRR